MPTQAQYDYLSKLLGLNLGRAPAAAPPAGDGGTAVMEAPAGDAAPGGEAAPGGDAAPGAPAAGATDGPPLPATDTELFFAKDSAKLTDSDTTSLDAYAAAMAATTDPITATGYASVDGDATHNSKLATERANAVKKYLTGKGIDAGRITAEGHGMTGQFGEKDLPSNRRVMLAPKPPAKAPPADAPPKDEYDGPADAPTNPPPPIPKLTPKQLEDILGPDKGVPRATVLKALTDFLDKLMQQQGGKSLTLTDTVRFAARALGKGLPNELGIEGKATGTTNRVPAELAKEIADLLPDFIPHENFNEFLKMAPKDPKAPEKFSITGALAKVLTPLLKKIIGGLPDSVQKKILDGLEDAIAKGLSTLAEKVLDENGVTGDEKKAILKAVEGAIQQKVGPAPPGGSADAPGAGEAAPGGDAAPGAPAAGATDGPPLPATDTELFFAKDSAKLTDSDTTSLDAYAAAMAATTDPITATGYASVDGDATHNSKLATERANAVKKYLTGKGIDAGRITAEGHGMTGQFGEKDLPSNRRVMLAPKPPAKAPPANAPPKDEYDGPADAPVDPRKIDLNITGLDPARVQQIIGEDKGEPRATIEKELADFLKQLMASQGLKSGVRITERVRLAANALAKGTKNENTVYAKLQDDRFGRDPDELAKEIAALLPDPVPRPNVDAFRAMKPKDIAAPEKFSLAGALAKVLTPPIKKAIAWLPEDIQKKITDSIEDGITKGITKATEALLDLNKVDGPTKEAILKAMEAAIKEKGEGAKQ